jgi:hypothetical protein
MYRVRGISTYEHVDSVPSIYILSLRFYIAKTLAWLLEDEPTFFHKLYTTIAFAGMALIDRSPLLLTAPIYFSTTYCHFINALLSHPLVTNSSFPPAVQSSNVPPPPFHTSFPTTSLSWLSLCPLVLLPSHPHAP